MSATKSTPGHPFVPESIPPADQVCNDALSHTATVSVVLSSINDEMVGLSDNLINKGLRSESDEQYDSFNATQHPPSRKSLFSSIASRLDPLPPSLHSPQTSALHLRISDPSSSMDTSQVYNEMFTKDNNLEYLEREYVYGESELGSDSGYESESSRTSSRISSRLSSRIYYPRHSPTNSERFLDESAYVEQNGKLVYRNAIYGNSDQSPFVSSPSSPVLSPRAPKEVGVASPSTPKEILHISGPMNIPPLSSSTRHHRQPELAVLIQQRAQTIAQTENERTRERSIERQKKLPQNVSSSIGSQNFYVSSLSNDKPCLDSTFLSRLPQSTSASPIVNFQTSLTLDGQSKTQAQIQNLTQSHPPLLSLPPSANFTDGSFVFDGTLELMYQNYQSQKILAGNTPKMDSVSHPVAQSSPGLDALPFPSQSYSNEASGCENIPRSPLVDCDRTWDEGKHLSDNQVGHIRVFVGVKQMDGLLPSVIKNLYKGVFGRHGFFFHAMIFVEVASPETGSCYVLKYDITADSPFTPPMGEHKGLGNSHISREIFPSIEFVRQEREIEFRALVELDTTFYAEPICEPRMICEQDIIDICWDLKDYFNFYDVCLRNCQDFTDVFVPRLMKLVERNPVSPLPLCKNILHKLNVDEGSSPAPISGPVVPFYASDAGRQSWQNVSRNPTLRNENGTFSFTPTGLLALCHAQAQGHLQKQNVNAILNTDLSLQNNSSNSSLEKSICSSPILASNSVSSHFVSEKNPAVEECGTYIELTEKRH